MRMVLLIAIAVAVCFASDVNTSTSSEQRDDPDMPAPGDLRTMLKNLDTRLDQRDCLIALACALVARGTVDAYTMASLYAYAKFDGAIPEGRWTAPRQCALFYERADSAWRHLYESAAADGDHPGHAVHRTFVARRNRRSDRHGEQPPPPLAGDAAQRHVTLRQGVPGGLPPVCIALGSDPASKLHAARRLIEAFARFVFSEPSAYPHDRLIVGRGFHPVGNGRKRASPDAVDVVNARLERGGASALDATGAWYDWLLEAGLLSLRPENNKPFRDLPVSYALLDEGHTEGYHRRSTYADVLKHLTDRGVRVGSRDGTLCGIGAPEAEVRACIDNIQPLLLLTYNEFERVTRGVLDIESAVPWMRHGRPDSDAIYALGSPSVEAALRAFIDEGVHAAAYLGAAIDGAQCGPYPWEDQAAPVLPRFSDVFHGPLYLVPISDHRIALLADMRSEHVASLVRTYDSSRIHLYEGRSRLFSYIPT